MSAHSHSEARRAWLELVALAFVALALAGAALHAHRLPADRDRLRPPIDELRSDAEELDLIAREMANEALPARVAIQHLSQLGEDTGRSTRELSSLQSPPALAGGQREGTAAGNELLELIERLSRGDDIAADLAFVRGNLTRLADALR